LYRSTRNLAYSRLRRRLLFGQLLRESPVHSSWLRPLNGAAPRPLLLVENALAALPARQREVVVLKVYEGRTFGEIARLLNISPNTAASRYRYALEKLRPLLEEHADAP
jgi:DNA-directed RNA polymerase specialized sigma24 family protein